MRDRAARGLIADLSHTDGSLIAAINEITKLNTIIVNELLAIRQVVHSLKHDVAELTEEVAILRARNA